MTAGRGLFDEGPSACPFVALDRDRDRRADEPDTRHRCYATPTPEPRALVHQRNYCLTKNFSSCPIFQDWAIRAAARPVPLRPVPPALALIEESRPVGEPELSPADEPVSVADEQPLQESLFDEPPVRPIHVPDPSPAPASALPPAPPMPTFRLTSVEDDEPPPVDNGPGVIPPPPRSRPPGNLDGSVSARPAAPMERVPSSWRESLAAAPPKPTPSHPIKTRPTLRREDIVPSWERAQYDIPDTTRGPRSGGGGGGDFFSRITMVFVALAVVALFGVLLVVFVPSLLHGIASGPTQAPSHTAAGSPTVAPSPTQTASPEASWQTYTIKLGDNLYAIAASFGLTYEQLLAANPQITNPDFIRAGDVLNIPPPNFVIPSPSGGGAASPEPSATP